MRSVKKRFFPLIGITLLILTQFSHLTVPITFAQGCNATGLVYRDYNQDGAQDSLEPPVAGVEVRAYNTAGVVTGPVTTDANGQYTLALSDPQARIEFTIPNNMNYLRYGRVWDGATETQSTSVNFADCTSGNTTFNMGVNNPGQYCEANPTLATTCFTIGPQTNAAKPVLVSFPSSSGSGSFGSPYSAPPNAFDLPVHTDLATELNIGTTWGLAYHRPSDTIFASAFMKRHVGLGPQGTGAIYAIRNGTTTVFSNTINGGPDLHPADSAPLDDWLRDVNMWDAVGKSGIGDIDISDDMSTLWAMNLADRSLYSIQITGNPPTAGTVGSDAVPLDQPDCGNPNVDIRPFAIEIKDGLVYVGVVCTAESTPATPANLRAYVYSFNPTLSTWTQVLNISLNYPRGCVNLSPNPACTNFPAEWNPWSPTFTGLSIPGQPLDGLVYPQPWLTDIVFDNDNMILGLRDRFGDQIGNGAHSTNPADPVNYIGVAAGDILRACSNGAGGWILEGNPGCASNSANAQGPGGGEYYFQDDLSTRHDELFMGGLVQIPGQPEVVGTFVDPIRITGPNDVLWDAGVRWMNNGNGQATRAYRLVNGEHVIPPVDFGKGNGLGDLTALCAPAPIEIGNRVWYDVNQNGIQDPDLIAEAPVGGVTVRLYSDTGTFIAATTTAADGSYYFNETNVTGGLQPGIFYNIRLDNAADYTGAGPLAGWTLTPNDLGTDVSDSDGTMVSGFPNIRVQIGNFGENNHTLDFGFFQGPTPTPRSPSATPGTSITATPGPGTTPTPPSNVFNKQADPPFAQPGDIVNWIITVFNPTNDTQTDINVTDTIPDALEIVNVSASAGNATWSGQNVTFTMASLAPQQTVVITITTRVRPGAPYIIENEALLRSINWGGVGDAGLTARAQVVLANQQPGTGETPWWRLPLLVAGIALGLAVLRLTLNRRSQN